MVMVDTVNLDFLGRNLADIQRDQAQLRSDVMQVRQLILLVTEKIGRLERNSHEMTDDLTLMLKSELSGTLANLEDRIEALIDRRITTVEEKIDQVLDRL
ncbi:hypothetical protein [Pelagibacterium sediminicola]|uniref:hypothetical protein n=1 Tax=Pelagibacterium sediminicola TaxID=2248761 RepID=UPI000E31238C|nr:hypothetical protein [Pelagibacterium sediminicola]